MNPVQNFAVSTDAMPSITIADLNQRPGMATVAYINELEARISGFQSQLADLRKLYEAKVQECERLKAELAEASDEPAPQPYPHWCKTCEDMSIHDYGHFEECVICGQKNPKP